MDLSSSSLPDFPLNPHVFHTALDYVCKALQVWRAEAPVALAEGEESALSVVGDASLYGELPPISEVDAALESDSVVDMSIEAAMEEEVAAVAESAISEAAEISIDLIGAALDVIPGVGEVALAIQVCFKRFSQNCW